MAIYEHMTPGVISVEPTATLKHAAILMSENGVTGLAVCEAARAGTAPQLLGEISRTDMLKVISRGYEECDVEVRPEWCDDGDTVAMLESIETMQVQHAMRDAVPVHGHTTMAEAAQLMYPHRLNRLFVTDEVGALLGILTSTDVMRVALCDEVSELDYGEL